ncbi:MAG: PCMD domain-containing protein, partial [Bacteroidales bacterium]
MYLISSLCKKYITRIAGMILVFSALQGCIENDIPYPRIPLYITGLEVRGASAAPYFDNEKHEVTVTLADSVNPRKVYVKSVEVTESAQSTIRAGQMLDLTNPVEVKLSLYQEYTWTVRAEQHIDRRFSIKGQV